MNWVSSAPTGLLLSESWPVALENAVDCFACLREVIEAVFCNWATLTSPRTAEFPLNSSIGTSVWSESEASLRISNMLCAALCAAMCREDGEALNPMLVVCELERRGMMDRGS